jgi:hypothetical protein
MSEPVKDLPPHDPLTCGLHGIDARGNPKAYCPRCIIDGDWRNDLLVPGQDGRPRRDDRQDADGTPRLA